MLSTPDVMINLVQYALTPRTGKQVKTTSHCRGQETEQKNTFKTLTWIGIMKISQRIGNSKQ